MVSLSDSKPEINGFDFRNWLWWAGIYFGVVFLGRRQAFWKSESVLYTSCSTLLLYF